MALSATETGSHAKQDDKSRLKRLAQKIGIGKKETKPTPSIPKAKVSGYEGSNIDTGGPETTYKRPNGEEIKRPEHSISTELAKRLKNNVHKELSAMKEEHRTMGNDAFRQMYVDSGHAYMLRLFDQFTKAQAGTDRNRTINEEEFKKFMETAEGLTVAYQVTMRKLQDMALPSAVYLNMQPGIPDQELVAPETIAIEGQGILAKRARTTARFLSSPLRRNPAGQPQLNTRFGQIPLNSRGTAGAAGAAIAGALSVINPMVGLGAIGAEAAGVGIARGFRPGERMATVRAAQALRAIVGNPSSSNPDFQNPHRNELEYMRRHLLINPMDINIVGPPGNENVEIRPLGINSTRIDAVELANQINGYAKDILEFQKATNIPQRQREPMDIRFLIDGTGAPSQQGNPLQQRVMERFLQHGGMRNMAGHEMNQRNAATGDWEPNPAYNRASPPDVAWNVYKWNLAYTEIMIQDMDDAFQRVVDGSKDYPANLKTKVDSRKNVVGSNSPAAEQRTQQITREITNLTTLTEVATINRGNLTTFEETTEAKRTTLRETNERVQALEQRIQIIPPTPPVPAGYQAPANIEVALQRILNDPTTTFRIEIDGESFGSIREEEDAIDADKTVLQNGAYTNWRQAHIDGPLAAAQAIIASPTATAEQIDRAQQRSDTLQQRASARLQEMEDLNFGDRSTTNKTRQELAKNLRSELLTAIRAHNEATNSLNNQNAPERRAAQQTLQTMQQTRNLIENWQTTRPLIAAGGALDLSTNALATETYAVLETRMNNAYALDQTIGWPTLENGQNRTRLMLAITEARATTLSPSVARPSNEFQNAIDPNWFGLQELDLLSLTPQELVKRMNNLVGLDIVQNIQAEARSRMHARQEAFNQIAGQLNQQRTILSTEQTRIEQHGMRSPELEVIELAVNRVSGNNQILEAITTTTNENISTLLNPAAANTQQALYNAEEQPYPIAYVNIIRWLVDTVGDTNAEFQNANPGQNAAFRRASQFLTPAIINTELAAWRPGTTLGNLQNQFNTLQISKEMLADFLTRQIVMTYMEQRVDQI